MYNLLNREVEVGHLPACGHLGLAWSRTWLTAEDEGLVDRLVSPGHPSTPGYDDPQYPIERR